jgi:hypothetical protein
VEKGVYASEKWGGYELIVADASTVERPGAKGTTARLHYATSPPARIDPLSLTRSGPHLDRAFVVAVCAR